MRGVGGFILCTPYQESVMDLLGTCAVPRPPCLTRNEILVTALTNLCSIYKKYGVKRHFQQYFSYKVAVSEIARVIWL
jgi:hypothetical protein